MKRFLCLMLSLVLLCALVLSGCGHEHVFAEATCTAAPTCTQCGKTEGEALGHDWLDATCTAPETCSRCGEVQGDMIPHSWVEANFQQPRTCSVCGAQEGEVLTPAFVTLGLDAQVYDLTDFAGQTFEYRTCGYSTTGNLPQYEATAEVIPGWAALTADGSIPEGRSFYSTGDMRIFEVEQSVLDLMAAIEEDAPEGYEWRVCCLDVHAVSMAHGIAYSLCFENYYDNVQWDDNEVIVELDSGTYLQSVVSMNGEELPTYRFGETLESSRGFRVFSESYYVPAGFDGCIMGLKNPAAHADGYVQDYTDGDTLFFRLR